MQGLLRHLRIIAVSGPSQPGGICTENHDLGGGRVISVEIIDEVEQPLGRPREDARSPRHVSLILEALVVMHLQRRE